MRIEAVESFIGESASDNVRRGESGLDNVAGTVGATGSQGMRASEAMGDIRAGRNLDGYAIALDAVHELGGKARLDDKETRLLVDSREMLQQAFGSHLGIVQSAWEDRRERLEAKKNTTNSGQPRWIPFARW